MFFWLAAVPCSRCAFIPLASYMVLYEHRLVWLALGISSAFARKIVTLNAPPAFTRCWFVDYISIHTSSAVLDISVSAVASVAWRLIWLVFSSLALPWTRRQAWMATFRAAQTHARHRGWRHWWCAGVLPRLPSIIVAHLRFILCERPVAIHYPPAAANRLLVWVLYGSLSNSLFRWAIPISSLRVFS